MAKSSFSFRRGGGAAKELPAFDYGARGKELPDIYLYSALTRLDSEAAETLGRARARLDALKREIGMLSGRLAASLDGPDRPKRRGRKRRKTR